MAIMKIKGTHVNSDTGEVIPQRIFQKGEFVQLFLGTMLEALGSSKVSAALLLHLLKRMDARTSTITLVLFDKQEIGKELGISTNHIDVSLNRLCKQGILSREGRARYMVNPYLLAKTDWNNILELRIIWEAVTKGKKSGKETDIIHRLSFKDLKNQSDLEVIKE